MINLEQIRELESKISKAVDLINVLRKENTALKTTLEKSQKRIDEFEQLIGSFKNDQSEIEKAILSAMKMLDALEDDMADSEETDRPGGEGDEPHSDSPGSGTDKDDASLHSRASTSDAERKIVKQSSEQGGASPAEGSEDGELDIF